VQVAAIVELRTAPESDAAVSACAALGLAVLRAHAPYEAIRGPDGSVAGLTVAPDERGRPARCRRVAAHRL